MALSTSSSSRVDARRNRERLVSAARDSFATGGTDVPVRDIAHRAGVGVATLYRHFPTRDALVDAVLEDAFTEFLAVAEAALAEDNAWVGFRHFVENGLVLHAGNRGLRDVTEAHASSGAFAAGRRRYREIVKRIVERAREEGTLRPDFAPQDMPLLFWTADRLLDLARDVAPEIWRRQIGFVLDGLRTEAAHPLSEPPLTYDQLDRLSGQGRG